MTLLYFHFAVPINLSVTSCIEMVNKNKSIFLCPELHKGEMNISSPKETHFVGDQKFSMCDNNNIYCIGMARFAIPRGVFKLTCGPSTTSKVSVFMTIGRITVQLCFYSTTALISMYLLLLLPMTECSTVLNLQLSNSK